MDWDWDISGDGESYSLYLEHEAWPEELIEFEWGNPSIGLIWETSPTLVEFFYYEGLELDKLPQNETIEWNLSETEYADQLKGFVRFKWREAPYPACMEVYDFELSDEFKVVKL